MKKNIVRNPLTLQIIAGRTLDEQIEYVRKYGQHGVAPFLRDRLLDSLGIPKPKATAENLIFFGCYAPFDIPLLLRDYIEILERLGLEYTYLEKDFCCGFPMIETSTGADRDSAREAGKEFMLMNCDLARQKGAKTISYCCAGCAYLAKKFFPNDVIRHLHYPDLIVEKLKNEKLRVAPTVVGYYEGCHRRYRAVAPGVDLDWGKYRALLDRIEGLKIVDLTHEVCCADYPERIVEEAEKINLDTILCSCRGCYVRVNAVARGRLKMKYFSEILLQALKGE